MTQLPLRIVFENLETDLAAIDVHVVYEDVSEAGAPSETLADWHFTDRSLTRDHPVLVVTVDLPAVEPSIEASLRVHVDTTGSEAITAGDYVSTAMCRIDDRAPAKPVHDEISIAVQRV